MTYTILYFENGEKKWKKASDIDAAEMYGKDHTDTYSDYDICVSLYEYDKLKQQIEIMKKNFEKIKHICGDDYLMEADMNKNWVFYRDEDNFKTIVFEGTEEECGKFCEDNNWELDGNELELWV